MSRSNKNHQAKKSEILDIAEDLFIRKGYDKITINDLLEKANISKGGFYHYFPSKENVLHSVIERLIDGLIERTKIILDDPNLNTIKKLKRILERNENFSINQFRNRQIIKNFYLNKNKTLIYHFHLRFKDKMKPLMTNLIKQGIKEGYFKGNLYLDETIEVIFMMVISANFLIIGKDKEDIRKYHYSVEYIVEKALGLEEGVLTVL